MYSERKSEIIIILTLFYEWLRKLRGFNVLARGATIFKFESFQGVQSSRWDMGSHLYFSTQAPCETVGLRQ